MTDDTHDDPTPAGDYVAGGEHAELLGRVHRRGAHLRRRRQAFVGSVAVAAALLVAVPIVAATGDGPASTSDLASDGGGGGESDGTAEPGTAASEAETTLPPETTTSFGECDPACTGDPTTTVAPTTTTARSNSTPPPPTGTSPDVTAPPDSTTTSTPPTTAPPGPPPRAECMDGTTGDTVVWVSNQSFSTPTQRIEVRVDGVVLTDRDFDVEMQHTFVMYCVDLGPGEHTISASTASDDTSITATAGNGVVVTAWDSADLDLQASPRWDQVGFA